MRGRPAKYRPLYPNLQKWILDHGYSMSTFGLEIGLSKGHISYVMAGIHDLRKSTIDAVLEKNGMTYEEAFAEEEV